MATKATLPTIPVGSTRPGLLITWSRDDGVENLNGATLTGEITSLYTGHTRAITGDLVISDANNGEFEWWFSAADVADDGMFSVKFRAEFLNNPTPAITFSADWSVCQ